MKSGTLSLQESSQPHLSGLTNAFIAVVLFSLTAPMTQMALAGFRPEAIALGRAALAGMCGLAMIIAMGWRLPKGREWLLLLVGGVGVSFGFPYFMSVTTQTWGAGSMGVALAGIPLVTSCLAAAIFKERHPWVFWACICIGTVLLMTFAWLEGQDQHKAGSIDSMVLSLLFAGLGYACGGRVAKTLGGWQTICWITALYLPLSLPAMGYLFSTNQLWVSESIDIQTWAAFLYLALISQWFGFKFWYGAMAQTSVAQTSQVQLLQPFFTLLFAVPLLGAQLHGYQFLFAGLIGLLVVVAAKYK